MPAFKEKLVHLDFKGAPPKASYLAAVFPLIKAWGATGLCLEWEDTLPFSGRFEVVRHPSVYSKDDVKQILQAARDSGLSVVPLGQTFGHLEMLLRHDTFADFRETSDSYGDLCPVHPDAGTLIRELIDQVIDLHPDIDTIHLGGDEVWTLGQHPLTREQIRERGKATIFVEHMRPLMEHVRARGHPMPLNRSPHSRNPSSGPMSPTFKTRSLLACGNGTIRPVSRFGLPAHSKVATWQMPPGRLSAPVWPIIRLGQHWRELRRWKASS
jgi:hypothetical protein